MSLILLAAKGLFFVLITFWSIRLSQISLATQPKPLTNNPPIIIFINKKIEGLDSGVKYKLQPAGISKIILPVGLFHLNNSNRLFILILQFLGSTGSIFHNFK